MKKYWWFLSEANIAQLKHLEHLPEAILTLGYDGAKESIEVLVNKLLLSTHKADSTSSLNE